MQDHREWYVGTAESTDRLPTVGFLSVPLETELKTYAAKLEELLAQEGQYVVILGTEIIGIYAAYEDALKVGYEKVGVEKSFLVKQIQSAESIHFFTRDILGECRT